MTKRDYNRTDDPLLRGWTRRQSTRAGVSIPIIVGVLLLVVALVALAVAAMPRPAHGAAVATTPITPLPTALIGGVPDPMTRRSSLPIVAREP